jgi:hypothetical protein
VPLPSLAPNEPLTCGNIGLGARTDTLYHHFMLVSTRDAQIINDISQFGQLASSHVDVLHFDKNTTNTPCNRVLARLVSGGYLATIERRPVGGTGGGSGPKCYQLGPKGWQFMRREGRYWPFRAISMHMIEIADAHVSLIQAARAGDFHIFDYETEPNNRLVIQEKGVDLRPDYYFHAAIPSSESQVTVWLEIDRGTERRPQLKDKIDKYVHAFKHATYDDIETFPMIIFIVPDEERRKELDRLINAVPGVVAEDKPIFLVQTKDSFPHALLS